MGISALLAAQILDASATGRSVLTGADASAIRTTLGLGTLATQSPTGTPSASTFLRGDFSWQTIDLSGYVPYSGATGAVNLGANGLTCPTLSLNNDSASAAGLNFVYAANGGVIANNSTRAILFNAGGITLTQNTFVDSGRTLQVNGVITGASSILEQRSAGFAQTFRLYGTYTDASNYRRLFLSSTTAGAFTIGVEGAGTGASGNTLTIASEIRSSVSLSTYNAATSMYGQIRLFGNNVADGRSGISFEQSNAFAIEKFFGVHQTLNTGAFVWQGYDRPSSAWHEYMRLAEEGNLTLAPRWNSAGTTFTGILANVTDTASNAASLLMDLQVGGSSKFKVDKSGVATIGTIIVGRQTSLYGGASVDEIRATTNNVLSVRFGSTNFAANRITGDAAGYQIAFATRYTSDTSYVAMISNGLSLGSTVPFGWSSTTSAGEASYDVSLSRDAAQTLAQRNGLNPQVHRVYNTFTDASNYERAKIAWESNVLRIGTEKAGTGSARALELQTDGVTRLTIASTGVGQATFTGTVYTAQNLQCDGDVYVANGRGVYLGTNRSGMTSSANGLIAMTNFTGNDFNRLQLGGTTSSFPSIKRNAAALNFRLADDSGDCDITAKAATFSGNVTITQGTANTSVLTSTGYSLTGSNAQSLIDVAGTWNTTGTPTLLKANVTDTASNAASLLLDLQVGGTSRFKVGKDGFVSVDPGVLGPIRYSFIGQTTTGLGYFNNGLIAYAANVYYWLSTGGFTAPSASWIGWSQTFDSTAGQDLKLFRDAARTLALRDGVNANVLRVYNTYTDSSNYERGKIAWESNVLRIGTEKAGTGSARALELQTDGTTRLTISSTGTLTVGTTNMTGQLRLQSANNTRLAQGGNDGDLQIYRNDASTPGQLLCGAATFSGNVTISAVNLVTDTTTGTKIGTATTQKIGFWNATPDVQPTTAVAAATLVGGGGTALTDTDTFDGYTIKQVVKALRNLGLLA